MGAQAAHPENRLGVLQSSVCLVTPGGGFQAEACPLVGIPGIRGRGGGGVARQQAEKPRRPEGRAGPVSVHCLPATLWPVPDPLPPGSPPGPTPTQAETPCLLSGSSG